MFQIDELKKGRKYLIAFTEETDPGYPAECYYEGVGIFDLADPSGYEKGTLRFILIEAGKNEFGYFDVENIVAEITEN